MKFDANLGSVSLNKVGELASMAERIGFDGVWISELDRTPFIPSALAIEHTKNIDVGTAIALAFPRSPAVTAYTAWNLQSDSDGRFILGLGTQVKGHMERRFSVKWESPGPKLREYIRSLHAIWKAWQEEGDLDFHGNFYSFDLMPPAFSPDPIKNPDIPIYISAVNEYNLRTVGRLCDGVHIHPFHSMKYISKKILPNIKKGAKSARRNLDDISLSASVFAVTGRNGKEMNGMREFVRGQLSFYGSTRTYRSVFEMHGWGEVCDELHELSVNNRWKEMSELITDEMIDVFSVEARPSQLRKRLEERYDMLDRVSIYQPFQGEDFWKDVL